MYRDSHFGQNSLNENPSLPVAISGCHNMPTGWNQCQQHDCASTHSRCHNHSWFSPLKCTKLKKETTWRQKHSKHITANEVLKFYLVKEQISKPYLLLNDHSCWVSIPPIFKTCTTFLLPQDHRNSISIHPNFLNNNIFNKPLGQNLNKMHTLKSISSAVFLKK